MPISRCRAVPAGVVLLAWAAAGAPPAAAGVIGGAARSAAPKFTLTTLGRTPATVRAGGSFRLSGRVRNGRGREGGTARMTFSLRRTPRASRGWYVPATGTSSDRNRGQNIRMTKGGHSRRFVVRVHVPSTVPAGRYWFRACVRSGSGAGRGSCKARRMRVTRRRGATPPGGGGTTPGGTTPGGQPGPAALRSLRAPLTDQNFYFVMADRFFNGDTSNDQGGLTGDFHQTGFDPTKKGYYHGGDLAGLIQKLDYIKGLGTTSIWLTPSFKNKPVQGTGSSESAGYHGYWITDFLHIDPHLGTNEELKALVRESHQKGMKVFFDIITNHTADVIGYRQKPGGPAPYGYVSKDDSPYRDAAGNPFDDRDFAGTNAFPPLSPATSFPFEPFNNTGPNDHKVPEWLNDVTVYHNRGDSTFAGENSQYGDFAGLDDLFTEQPRVVAGMEDIYKYWVDQVGIDGFRIDTMKHVNDEFWQQFSPAILDYARNRTAQRRPGFFMFGEVFDTTRPFTSHYTTHNGVQAVLDFPFQDAARDFASRSASASRLRDFFAADDWYTDADSNAYQLPTFLGNHDMGHIGMFLRDDNPAGTPESELLARDELAHELMYFSRGNPVVYFGDEQGFTGAGGDQAARQDMFASQDHEYDNVGDDAGKNDDIGSNQTPMDDNFDAGHPLYAKIAQLAQLTQRDRALRDGPQQSRYASDGAGIYAFSRLDRRTQQEYVVALNNAEAPRSALVPTSAAGGATFTQIYPSAGGSLATQSDGRLPVSVPALSTVVYRSDAGIPRSAAAPRITLQPLPDGGAARDRAEIRAFVDGDSFYDVTFEAKVGDGPWTPIGTDDNRPYRVFHDISDLAPGTLVQYRATVLDNADHARTSDVAEVRVAEPSITLTGPAQGTKVRGATRLTAEAVPDHNDYAVTFQRRIAGGDWTDVGRDDSQGAYTAVDTLPNLPEGTEVRYRAVLAYPGGSVAGEERTYTVAPPPVTTAVVHYCRPAGDYADWGLHLWGDGKAGPDTDWAAPRQRDGVDAEGAFFNIPIANDTRPVNFIVHRPSGDTVPTTREPGGDRSFIPADHSRIWLKQGDPTIYFTPSPCS